jgi:hypothetical protein
LKRLARTTPVDELLAGYPGVVQEIATAARAMLKGLLPDIQESADTAAKLIGYGYGPGYKHAVCNLILSQKEVKLGIVYGASLPDPRKLMTGAGKVHRHVPLRSPADSSRPGLKALLQAALEAQRARAAQAKSKR